MDADGGWTPRLLIEESGIGPTLYRSAADPVGQLMPAPVAVAQWLHKISNQRLAGTEHGPEPTTSAHQRARLLSRLRGYLPHDHHPGYSWSDDRPLTQADHHVAG
jgi:hypothetical protein